MPKIAPMMILPPMIFAGIATTFFVGMQRDDPDALPSTREGLDAPLIQPVAVADLPTFGADELNGEGIKIVNFWASWCAPCRVEHPHIVGLGEEFPVYGINGDTSDRAALGFLDELGNPYDGVVRNDRNVQSIEWGVYALPETFIIDDSGEVILHFRGPVTQRALESRVLPAIRAAQAGN